MTTRILQISDLHIGDENHEAEKLDVIIEHIISKKVEWDVNETIIIVTGDITQRGKKEEFVNARNAFAHLKHQTGYEILFLPGNHDYGAHGVAGKVVASRFEDFKQIFGRVFPDLIDIQYPYAREIRGHFIINLDSMQGQVGTSDDRLADGEVGSDQLKKLDIILSSPEIKNRPKNKKVIVCIHHHPFIFPGEPFWVTAGEKVGHALDDDDEFRKVIKSRADVLIFGHDHKHYNFSDTVYSGDEDEDAYDISKILSCGKSTESGSEFILTKEGEVDKRKTKNKKDRKSGLLGWLIEIDDEGNIKEEIEVLS